MSDEFTAEEIDRVYAGIPDDVMPAAQRERWANLAKMALTVQRSDAPRIGEVFHGFASGVFGRDSYYCRRVEAVGRDWVVTRNENGHAEFAASMTRERLAWCREAPEPGHICALDDDLRAGGVT